MTHIRLEYSYNNLIINNGINYDDGDSRTVAFGVRNSVGFDWHPITNNLYFTDNGANDIYPSQSPPWDTYSPDDELNVILNEGDHFGYPYLHSNGSGNPYLRNVAQVNGIQDEIYYTSAQYQLAIQPLGPHSAVLGMKFYNRDLLIEQGCAKGTKYPLFPSQYNNAIFLAQHGSWSGGYQLVLGYRIDVVKVTDSGDSVTIDLFDNFVTGFRENGDTSTILNTNAWARPAFVEILYDGSILISDDQDNYVFRVTYTGSDATTYDCPTTDPTTDPTLMPSNSPSMTPTDVTNSPTTDTNNPSISPTDNPTLTPSDVTSNPTNNPSQSPIIGTHSPTTSPSKNPSNSPTNQPTIASTSDGTNNEPTSGEKGNLGVSFSDINEFTLMEW
eukprot:CAMPEP_0201571312 /NCGR_PEP_ID=MMETSP0190_2-20130828/14012_1 /ASSEMBLY_ACC=CAM_ASM_000263 /TAXON_ID=37353 /ORGANISM="Rosalina sp." /LENGTH=385 /DNA_ID=CAMNT_0047995805 /DNA_START=508 /DNA_END=1662 /DNA_ORIENTATION=+